jgi:hypothetical protein
MFSDGDWSRRGALDRRRRRRPVEEGPAVGATGGGPGHKVEGETIYQMDLVVDGLARGVVIAADGTIASVEQEIAWDQVPADVQTNFTNVTGKGKLGPVSSVTKQGNIVAYQAVLETKGERALVQVKPKPPVLDPIPTAGSQK